MNPNSAMKALLRLLPSFLLFTSLATAQPALVVDVDPALPGIQVAVAIPAGSPAFLVDVYLVHDGVTPFDTYGYALEFNDTAGILAIASPTFFDPTGLGIGAVVSSPAPVDVFLAPPAGGAIVPGGVLAAGGYAPGGVGPGGPFAGTDGGTLVTEALTFFPGGLPPAGSVWLLSSTMFTPVTPGVSDIAPIGIFPGIPAVPPGTAAFAAIIPPPGPPAAPVAEFYLTAVGAILPAAGVAPYPVGINPGTVTVTAPLAVELSDFAVVVSNSRASIGWTTLSETNNQGFHIEMIEPGSSQFRSVKFVDGIGTSTQSERYQTSVELEKPGEYTFRLRQVDFDGSTTYSNDVEVSVDLPGQFYVSEPYPNPFAESFSVSIGVDHAQFVDVRLYNLAGERVGIIHSGWLDNQQVRDFSIRGNHLSTGVYIVRAKGESFSSSMSVVKVE